MTPLSRQTLQRPVAVMEPDQGALRGRRSYCSRRLRVITTFMGKGVVDADDESFLFNAGLHARTTRCIDTAHAGQEARRRHHLQPVRAFPQPGASRATAAERWPPSSATAAS